MRCSNCGAEVKQGFAFCAVCGTPVQSSGNNPAQPVVAPSPVQPGNPGQVFHKKSFALGAAAVVGVLLGFAVFALRAPSSAPSEDAPATQAAQKVAVTVPVEAEGLDGSGSRIPMRVTGTTESGAEVDRVAFVSPTARRIKLEPGDYEVSVIESPISAQGVLYTVPETTLHIVLDAEALESGKTEPVEETLVLEPRDMASVTDEEIEAALEYVRDDAKRAERADELSQASQAYRTSMLEASYTVHFTGFDMVLPEAWWDRVSTTTTSGNFATEQLTWGNCILVGNNTAGESGLFGYDPFNEGPLQLSNGYTATKGALDDGYLYLVVDDGAGHRAVLMTLAYGRLHIYFAQLSEEEIMEAIELQAAAAGVSAEGHNLDSDNTDIAYGCLIACAENMTFN